MKYVTFCSFIGFVSPFTLASAPAANRATTTPGANQVVSLSTPGSTIVPRFANGMSAHEVEAIAGAPDAKLGANVWVYWKVKAEQNRAHPHFDTLLVLFDKGGLSSFKFVEAAPVRALITQVRVQA